VLRMLPTGRTILPQLHPVWVIAFVLIARIVPAAALRARPPEPSIMYPALPRHALPPSSSPPARGQHKTSRRPLLLPARLTSAPQRTILL